LLLRAEILFNFSCRVDIDVVAFFPFLFIFYAITTSSAADRLVELCSIGELRAVMICGIEHNSDIEATPSLFFSASAFLSNWN